MGPFIQPTLIVGLGNPGAEYQGTRHNIGFRVVDALALHWNVSLHPHNRFQGQYGEGQVGGQRVRLLKPLTYMNQSGRSVQAVLSWFKLPVSNLLVVYDDADLPLGRLRLRLNGSTGGHNGIKSIIEHTHSQDFPRLKVGIAYGLRLQQSGPRNAVPYVLGNFSRAEQEFLPEVLTLAIAAIEVAIKDGVEKAMNHYNSKTVAVKIP